MGIQNYLIEIHVDTVSDVCLDQPQILIDIDLAISIGIQFIEIPIDHLVTDLHIDSDEGFFHQGLELILIQ